MSQDPSKAPIPVNVPSLDGNERKYLLSCIDEGWISSEGPFVERFEREFSAAMGRKHGVAMCNGSLAIDAAIVALGIGEGDEVILPSFTIISCAAAIVRAGAVPVFVDSDPATWNMDVSRIEERITPRTKAIMVVHIYGLPVDMDPVLALARKHGLKIIEDAAEMHGQDYRGRPCGSFGDISTFSFYPNKHVTTGEGGMALTDDPQLFEKLRSLRNLCFVPERRFVHHELGWNLRMTNLQAALGVAQLERLSQFVRRKREIGAKYNTLLGDLGCLEKQAAETPYARNIYWVYGMVLSDSVPFDATEAMSLLAKEGIGTRPFFWPMHEQPVFEKYSWFKREKLPVSERIARRGFYIPSGLGITDEQLERVGATVRRIFSKYC